MDRRGGSGVAAVAALASCGEPVLVLCADALRRRELVERAAAPARFGGGPVAIASARLADAAVHDRDRRGAGLGMRRGPRRLGRARARARDGRALRARRRRRPAAVPAPRHGRPPPAAGFLHEAWGQEDVAMAVRGHAEEWPRRASLAALYRVLRDRQAAAPSNGRARRSPSPSFARSLHGPGRHPRAPEVGARRIRVLEEIGAIEWELCLHTRHAARRILGGEGSRADGVLRRYRERYEEGRRFLSRRRQPS